MLYNVKEFFLECETSWAKVSLGAAIAVQVFEGIILGVFSTLQSDPARSFIPSSLGTALALLSLHLPFSLNHSLATQVCILDKACNDLSRATNRSYLFNSCGLGTTRTSRKLAPSQS